MFALKSEIATPVFPAPLKIHAPWVGPWGGPAKYPENRCSSAWLYGPNGHGTANSSTDGAW